MANRPSEPQGDADLIRECIYDHGNGKYKGEKSAAQRAEAFAALERLKAQSAEGPSMTDKTTAMTELPEPELGYIETDKSRQPAFSARQMREALQSAQPAAAVSDAAIYAVWTQHCQTPGTTTRQLVCAFARAVLSAAKAGGWQPIETAPKDGARFLAWRKHATRPLVARYCKDFDWFEDEDGVHLYHLTHWQPLPNPPKDPA